MKICQRVFVAGRYWTIIFKYETYFCSASPKRVNVATITNSRSLHWLPVAYPIKYKVLLLTFKYPHISAPVYLQDVVQMYTPTRCLHSSSKLLLPSPLGTTKYYGHAVEHKSSIDRRWSTQYECRLSKAPCHRHTENFRGVEEDICYIVLTLS